jgi:hypothetical protein
LFSQNLGDKILHEVLFGGAFQCPTHGIDKKNNDSFLEDINIQGYKKPCLEDLKKEETLNRRKKMMQQALIIP